MKIFRHESSILHYFEIGDKIYGKRIISIRPCPWIGTNIFDKCRCFHECNQYQYEVSEKIYYCGTIKGNNPIGTIER